MKALALVSGGLDSSLAVKLLQEQGIEVEAVNFHTGFCTCGDKAKGLPESQKPVAACVDGIQAVTDHLKVKLHRINVSQEYIKEVVTAPKHGYGSQMNPCLDCRIFILKKAKEMMAQVGASFLVSGEVLNQRPMTQHDHQMALTEREAGVEGLVVRPLTGRHMPESVAEREGWVDRERMLALHGRSRKPQLQMAADKGLEGFTAPAGGCLLTDPGFSRRLRDLFDREGKGALNLREVLLLKLGRHFRLPSGVKLIVGRRHEENEKLSIFRRPDEPLFDTPDVPGPKALLRGPGAEGDVTRAAAITARYSDADKAEPVRVRIKRDGAEQLVTVQAADPASLEALRV